MYNDVDIRKGWYGKVSYDKDGNETGFRRKGRAAIIKRILSSIENKEVYLDLEYKYLGKLRHYVFARKNIVDKRLVSDIAGNGVDVTSTSFNTFVDSLRFQESFIKGETKSFEKLGWIQIPSNKQNSQWCYRCSELIGDEGIYLGSVALAPQGTLDGWKKMLKKEVLGNTGLELAVLAGLSAVVVGYIGVKATCDNPIIHLNLPSGRGKSTTCSLVCSVSGEMFEGERTVSDEYGDAKSQISIYGSWGATEKATISTNSGNRGVVVILNELGKFMGKDMTSIIFNLSEGSDIKRLRKDLACNVSDGYNTVFVSCGEMSLVSRCKSKLDGIRIRVMEIQEALTKDAAHARRIKQACQENNGHAAPVLAKYIIDNYTPDDVLQHYKKVLDSLIGKAPKHIPDRFIEKFPAYFVTTAEIAEKALGIKFNVDTIVDFCYKCYDTQKAEEGSVDSSYNDVIGECKVNINNFYDNPNDVVPKVVWGNVTFPAKIDGNTVITEEYAIRKSVLNEILDRKNHPNVSTCIKKWKEAGVLSFEKGRNTRERKINGVSEDVYVLQVRMPYNPDIHKPKNVKSSLVKKSNVKVSKIRSLLEEIDEDDDP